MMFFIICMLGACTAEELAGPESGVEDDAPVVIAISPADITSVNMNSRAAGDNSIFSVIDDVNVKVNYGGNTVIVYLVKNGDSFEVSGSVENGSAEVVSSKTADGKVYIHIVSIRPRACFFPLFSFLPLWLHYNLNPLCVQY